MAERIEISVDELEAMTYNELLGRFGITEDQALDSECDGDSDEDDGFPLRTTSQKSKRSRLSEDPLEGSSTTSGGCSTTSGSDQSCSVKSSASGAVMLADLSPEAAPNATVATNLSVVLQITNSTYRSGHDASLWGPKRDPLYIVIPVTIFYSLIFVTGLIGNVSTCVVIAKNRGMHTATNYYLFSLAVSDLVLLISGLPQEMYTLWSKYPYVFGEVFCVLQGFTSETSTNATVLTITAFTVERYVAICHPFLSQTVSKLSRAIKFIVFIWIISFLLAIPQAMQLGLVYEKNRKGEKISEEYKICTVKNRFRWYSFEISALVFFFIPMSVITVLYVLIGMNLHRAGDPKRRSPGLRGSRKGPSKSTRRVLKMLIVVVVAFFICWAPFQGQRLFALYGDRGKNTSSAVILFYQVITYASGLLYYFSTTVNPFLYNIMSHKFRDAFKQTTLSRCLSGKGEVIRSELGGSSEGGRPRFNYSMLSHRSGRCAGAPAHSLSSGHSFIDPFDLHHKRPPFRRKGPASDPPSLELLNSPEKRELLEVPRCNGEQKRVIVQTYVPRTIRRQETKPRSPKVPRIEDIEIFQESQLKITTRKKEEIELDFSCPEYRSDKETENNNVKKSYTVPCLVLN